MKEYLKDNFSFWNKIPVTAEQEVELKLKFDTTFEQRNSADQKTLYASFNGFAVEVFNILNNNIGFAFTTTGHTGNPVPVFAVGVGADRFKSLNNNILIPRYIEEIINE
jgi:alkaline phosphatase